MSPNSGINLNFYWGDDYTTLEYTYSKFQVPSWHLQQDLVELTFQLCNPTLLPFEQYKLNEMEAI